MTSAVLTPPAPAAVAPPELERRPTVQHVLVYVFVLGPVLALAAGVVLATRGHLLTWADAVTGFVLYVVTGLGVTVGYHRHLTHGAFKTRPWVRAAMSVAGCMAVQGGPARWVADHRRHHANSDRPGDPHSPWRFGTTPGAVARGAWWSHIGWLLSQNRTSIERYAPDLLADRAVMRVERTTPLWVAVSLLLPALVGFAVSGGSLAAAGLALLWAGLVRVFLLHHVTWSINSVCHMWGERPFRARDRSANVWPLALVSFGESWHNYHHADPTSARHGVGRRQVDISAGVIAGLERLGWAWDVRWPTADRVAARRLAAGGRP